MKFDYLVRGLFKSHETTICLYTETPLFELISIRVFAFSEFLMNFNAESQTLMRVYLAQGIIK